METYISQGFRPKGRGTFSAGRKYPKTRSRGAGGSPCGASDFLDGQKVTKEALRDAAGARLRATYFLRAEKVGKDALKGSGHGDRALRLCFRRVSSRPAPPENPRCGGRGTRTGSLAVTAGARGSSGGAVPLPAHWGLPWVEDDSLCPRGVRLAWHMPPGGVVGWGAELPALGRWLGVRVGDLSVRPIPRRPRRCAPSVRGDGFGDAVPHPWGATTPARQSGHALGVSLRRGAPQNLP